MRYDVQQLRKYLASDFRLFLDYVLQQEGLTISNKQIEMGRLVQSGYTTVALFAARGFAKTYTIMILYGLWRILRNPNIKIMFLSGATGKANKNAKSLRGLLDELDLFEHVRPHSGSGVTCFDLKGSKMSTSAASVDSCGVDSRKTGVHVNLVLCDDLEQDENMGSLAARDHILEQIQKIRPWTIEPASDPLYNGSVPIPERTTLVVAGTFNCGRDSVYLVNNQTNHWLAKASTLIIPAINEKGESNFPEIKSTAYLLEEKESMTSSFWQNQYQMDPEAIDRQLCPFDLNLIRSLSRPMICSELSCVVDWSEGHDYFAVALMGPSQGSLYVEDIMAWQGLTSNESFQRLAEIIKQRRDDNNAQNIYKVYIEASKNDIARPDALIVCAQRAFADSGLLIQVVPYKTRTNKLLKILDLEPALHTGSLILAEKVLAHELFIRELTGTRFGSLPRPHDDTIDAVASGVEQFSRDIGPIHRQSMIDIVEEYDQYNVF